MTHGTERVFNSFVFTTAKIVTPWFQVVCTRNRGFVSPKAVKIRGASAVSSSMVDDHGLEWWHGTCADGGGGRVYSIPLCTTAPEVLETNCLRLASGKKCSSAQG